mmetsp:Transcript_61100/g.122499  ORF Transcript_61100/g.122499 Transcript_61100/m.122499 type:complete len:205 (-) Transcript_61100:1305-1919(-)
MPGSFSIHRKYGGPVRSASPVCSTNITICKAYQFYHSQTAPASWLKSRLRGRLVGVERPLRALSKINISSWLPGVSNQVDGQNAFTIWNDELLVAQYRTVCPFHDNEGMVRANCTRHALQLPLQAIHVNIMARLTCRYWASYRLRHPLWPFRVDRVTKEGAADEHVEDILLEGRFAILEQDLMQTLGVAPGSCRCVSTAVLIRF